MDKFITLHNGGELHEYDGNLYWYLHGQYHNENGPAIQYWTGHQEWFLNGVRHREDGPAIIYDNGEKEWFLNGKHIVCETQNQFERLMRLKAFW